WKDRYDKKYPGQFQVYSPYTYDATHVLVQAMIDAGSADPKVYLPVLAKTDGYKGVTGTISFDEKGDIKNGALTLHSYKGGKETSLGVVH
ncbi:MAG TPA: branched-chain amino acid ABC transporter substrate-binding protein, partial [Burkholderiaceae bacterium]|nr:branched-chain amino acid ABC transporter substrate-binding protein [Burkholderiaceae bacterium]